MLNFPAAVRAGFSADDGYPPEAVMSGLKAWLANTKHNNGVMQDRDDGRVEDCGVRLSIERIVVTVGVASFRRTDASKLAVRFAFWFCVHR